MTPKSDGTASAGPIAGRSTTDNGHHVVVIGAGFGGLQLVQSLRGAGARITLIDQRNHHLFQPLLYQVARRSLRPPKSPGRSAACFAPARM